MKNIKMFALGLLLALIVPTFNVQAAAKADPLPVYQNYISEINLGYDNAMLNGDIILSNGAILHIVDYKTRDDVAMSKWSAGDAVVFSSHANKEKLILSLKRVVNGTADDNVEPYAIFDIINAPDTLLTISEIREKGKFIKLSDNSVWEFSYYNTFSTEDWSVGERVLVSGRGDKNTYNFINLDVPLKHNVYSATASLVVD